MGRLSCVWSLVVCSMILGCGSSGEDVEANRPKRIAVSGTVTLGGMPVEGATVSLHPAGDGKGALGITDSAGKFTLGTFDKNDGAVAGDYKVTITKLESASSGTQPAPGEPGYNPNPKSQPPKNLLPVKYADPTKSGLTATIADQARTDLDFALDAAAK